MPFEIILNIGTSIIAASIVFTFLRIIRSFRNFLKEKEKLKIAEETRFQEVLASDSLYQLGNYLDTKLGSFLVSEYVKNSTVQGRIDSILNNIQKFVGYGEEIGGEFKQTNILDRKKSQPNESFRRIFNKLELGEPWDALATMRRHLEIQLRRFAGINKINVDVRLSASRIVKILSNKGIISKPMTESLLYSIRVANNGIHGKDVSLQEAEEAIWIAQNALSELQIIE